MSCNGSGACSVRISSIVDKLQKYFRRSGGACIQVFEKRLSSSEGSLPCSKGRRTEVSSLLGEYEPSGAAYIAAGVSDGGRAARSARQRTEYTGSRRTLLQASASWHARP